jgi:UDP-glucose 4-epimerase
MTNIHSASNQIEGRIVVLGGLGFMGSHLCRELVRRGCQVRIFDKLYASHELIRDFERDVEIVNGEVGRPDDVLNAIADADKILYLVHTTVPGSSMSDPAYDVTSNVVASVKWLQRVAETKVSQIYFVSSGGAVYGVPQTNPIDEEHPTNPISSYGITKLAIEKYVAMYSTMFGIEYRTLRPSNVYGPGQRLHIGQGIIGVMADRALRGEPIEVWGTGENLRDYLYIEDMVSATMALLAYTGPKQVFNVSSGQGHSILSIMDILRRQLGSLPPITYKAGRSFDPPINVLDSSRLRTVSQWQPKVDLEMGIARTIDWLKNLPKQQE